MLQKLNVKTVVEEVSVISVLFKDPAVKIGGKQESDFFLSFSCDRVKQFMKAALSVMFFVN